MVNIFFSNLFVGNLFKLSCFTARVKGTITTPHEAILRVQRNNIYKRSLSPQDIVRAKQGYLHLFPNLTTLEPQPKLHSLKTTEPLPSHPDSRDHKALSSSTAGPPLHLQFQNADAHNRFDTK